jgi:hypothetical protein
VGKSFWIGIMMWLEDLQRLIAGQSKIRFGENIVA